MTFHVDPGFLPRWREELFYSSILSWARRGFIGSADAAISFETRVYIGKRAIAIRPNGEEMDARPGVWVRGAADERNGVPKQPLRCSWPRNFVAPQLPGAGF